MHGQPRATRDIDLVIDPSDANIEILVARFPTDRLDFDSLDRTYLDRWAGELGLADVLQDVRDEAASER